MWPSGNPSLRLPLLCLSVRQAVFTGSYPCSCPLVSRLPDHETSKGACCEFVLLFLWNVTSAFPSLVPSPSLCLFLVSHKAWLFQHPGHVYGSSILAASGLFQEVPSDLLLSTTSHLGCCLSFISPVPVLFFLFSSILYWMIAASAANFHQCPLVLLSCGNWSLYL